MFSMAVSQNTPVMTFRTASIVIQMYATKTPTQIGGIAARGYTHWCQLRPPKIDLKSVNMTLPSEPQNRRKSGSTSSDSLMCSAVACLMTKENVYVRITNKSNAQITVLIV